MRVAVGLIYVFVHSPFRKDSSRSVLWGKLARTMQGLGCGVYLAASCVILEVAVKFLERMRDFGKHRCCLRYKINGNGAALWS